MSFLQSTIAICSPFESYRVKSVGTNLERRLPCATAVTQRSMKYLLWLGEFSSRLLAWLVRGAITPRAGCSGLNQYPSRRELVQLSRGHVVLNVAYGRLDFLQVPIQVV